VTIRRQVHASEIAASQRSSIPITVRQLEAIVRISESLAKLQLAPVATEAHVDEAIRLFLASTMDAVAQGERNGMGANINNAEMAAEMGRIEEELRRRLPIGWNTSLATLRREFIEGRGYNEGALAKVLGVMQRRESIQMRNGGTSVYRTGP
jgi:DNA replication licensing factor MCM5